MVCSSSKPKILVLDANGPCGAGLKRQHVFDLIGGCLAAIRIQDLLTREQCPGIVSEILRRCTFSQHPSVADLGYAGVPLFEARKSQRGMEAYHNAHHEVRSLIAAISPRRSILDLVTEVISEAHPLGVEPLMVGDRPAPEMIIRKYPEKTAKVKGHRDILREEIDLPIAHHFLGQLGGNVYPSVPDEGGNLRLYQTRYSEEEFYALSGGEYGLDDDILGEPEHEIHPQIGELILISSECTHAVTAGAGSSIRMTLSFFLGILEDRPWVMWA